MAWIIGDMGMVQQPIRQGGGECLILGEAGPLLTDWQIARDDDARVLVALCHHVEEKVHLIAPERQIADLINHQ